MSGAAYLTPEWREQLQRWAHEPLNCKWCGRNYREIDNVGRWYCMQHRQELPTDGHWPCCGKRAAPVTFAQRAGLYTEPELTGCTPSDHRAVRLPWQQMDSVPMYPAVAALVLHRTEAEAHPGEVRLPDVPAGTTFVARYDWRAAATATARQP